MVSRCRLIVCVPYLLVHKSREFRTVDIQAGSLGFTAKGGFESFCEYTGAQE
jgi:hypothetical protein